jgi:AmmeMemoRadiSam system protein B
MMQAMSALELPLPALRPLEVSPLLHGPDGQVGLRDPLGLADSGAKLYWLSPIEWSIARRFDGLTSARQVAQRLAAEVGSPLEATRVLELSQRLSAVGLLDDHETLERTQRALERLRKQDRRPALVPGSELPADAFDLRIELGGLVADDWDMPQLPHARGLLAPAGPIRTLAPLYSRSYASVRHAQRELKRIVLLGNLRARLGEPLIPLFKDFDTPLGPVPMDRSALLELGLLPGRLQLAHFPQRDLERQALFLRLLFPGVPVVALLVEAFPAALTNGQARGDAVVETTLQHLQRLDALPGRTLWIAAADSYRLGEPSSAPPDERLRHALLGGTAGRRIRETDQLCLEALETGDSDAYLAAAFKDQDPLRNQFAPAAYFLKRLLENEVSFAADAEPNQLLRCSPLGYLERPGQGCILTACAAVWH